MIIGYMYFLIQRRGGMLNDKNITYAKLKDVCEIKRGEKITRDEIIDIGYPIISGGKNYLGYANKYNANENTITISRAGNPGFVNSINEKFWITDFCFYIGKTIKNINYRYLYYYLKSIQDEIYSLCLSGSISTLNMANLSLLSIAFPSLDTQNKIVSILDQFNNLTTNLQDGIPAEIKLRQEQYQYYLKQLLNFNITND